MILVLLSPRQRGLDLTDVAGCAVVTGGPVPSGAGSVTVVGEYTTEAVVAAGLEVARRNPISRVVSFAEADVLAAARLRDLLDLPGQRGPSAAAYRDKALMREHLADAGLPGPHWQRVETAAEVRGFASRFALPLVVKPRWSSGSVGVRLLHTESDLAGLPATLPGHLAEQFVPGDVVHVDGLVVDGRRVFALPAAYTELGCLAHLQDSGSGSHLLAGDHPWRAALCEELWQVVDALPSAGSLLLHAEFFVAEGRRPVLCEIASRLPGHPIPPMLDRALNCDLRRTWLRVAAGLPVDVDAISRAAQAALPVANYGLPPRRGRLVELPSGPPEGTEDWLHDLDVLARPGQFWDEADYESRKSGDFVLSWTVTAPDERKLRDRLRLSADLLQARTVWQAEQSEAACDR
ncbi:hypothetical protein OHS58_06205 [Amycolatopsis sp. NBC_00348]|uniref:ATP-grasp domain-containing protein n=1 Tax=Amycolatopsis sp. NBC_00348 TaxID=2975956 RepID=UPI002E275F7E